MQTISAAAGRRIVKCDLQIVVSQKPVERGPRFLAPAAFACSPIGLQARRDHGTGFDRLLIESRLFRFLGIEAL